MLKLAIFGTGTSGERAVATLARTSGVSIVAAADNAPAKHGQVWHGHRIVSAEDLVAAGGWDYVCIASQWNLEIAEQLIGLGLEPDRIAVFGPGGGPVVAGADGLHELLPSRIGDDLPVCGFEEDFERLKFLRRLGFDPRAVLDVGASNGPWSVTCAQVFPEAHYYLMEPLPHYERQALTARAAGWHRLSIAAGAADGHATISVPESKWGAFGATMLESASGRRWKGERLRVPMRRIDTLLDEGRLAPPQLVKLDVQGYEGAVLAGGERLWHTADVFFVELSLDRYWAGASTMHEMIALFARHGFFPFDLFHEFRNETGLLVQIDCIFLRADSALARRQNLWQHVA